MIAIADPLMTSRNDWTIIHRRERTHSYRQRASQKLHAKTSRAHRVLSTFNAALVSPAALRAVSSQVLASKIASRIATLALTRSIVESFQRELRTMIANHVTDLAVSDTSMSHQATVASAIVLQHGTLAPLIHHSWAAAMEVLTCGHQNNRKVNRVAGAIMSTIAIHRTIDLAVVNERRWFRRRSSSTRRHPIPQCEVVIRDSWLHRFWARRHRSDSRTIVTTIMVVIKILFRLRAFKILNFCIVLEYWTLFNRVLSNWKNYPSLIVIKWFELFKSIAEKL